MSNYAQQESNNAANQAFIIGYYESMLKSVLNEIKEGNTDYVNISIPRLIEKTLNTCGTIWENRYEKHWTEIVNK